MRSLALCAALVLVACGDDTTVIPVNDLSVSVPRDMAGGGGGGGTDGLGAVQDMAGAAFPMQAAVMVGPGGSNSFAPGSVDIAAGGTVTWTWVSGSHSATSGTAPTPNGNWDSGVKTSGTFSHTFANAGTVPYFCTVHGVAMTGTVIVH